jgi:anaerobic selenocysteine-containing dehydrogenase
MAHVHQTYCRNCPSLCGLKVEVEDNRILSITGDRDHPVTKGYFCIKGLASLDLHNGEDRLTASRKGRGAAQAEVDVEQALDEMHERLASIVAEHGPEAVAMYYGTGANNNSLCHSAMKGWMGLLGSPYIFSSMTVDQSAKWVAMGRMGWFAPGKHSIIDADVAMLVGSNPAVSHTGLPAIPTQNPRRWMRDARTRGVKLIVVDPRVTETAKFADIHLQIRPGQDAALFAGMIKLALDRGWADEAFCARFVRPLDALREAVSGFSLADVAERTGLSGAQIEAATEMFAKAYRPTASSGTGPNMGPSSNLAEHLIEAFSVICGAYRRAGDIVRNTGALYGSDPVVEKVYPAMRPWEHGPRLRTADVGPMFGEYPTALLPDEILGLGNDCIRALIVVGGNPARAISDPERTLAALGALELLVSLDIRPTETTALSDYVIATSLPYERDDFTGIYDPLLSTSFAQVATPFMRRPPRVVDDWEVFWGLARRMGRPMELKRPMFGAPHDQIPGPALTLDMGLKPTTEGLVRWLSTQGPVSYADLLRRPEGLLGGGEAATVQPADEDLGERLDIFPPDVAEELASFAAATPADGFKYLLTVRRLLETMNSAYRNASKTRGRYPVNPAFMHPEDMAADGIVADAAVEITSDHGAVVAYAQPDPGMRRGVVAMAHGWGAADASLDPEGRTGAFTGRLVSLKANREAINYMPRQSAIPVNVRPRPAARAG